MLLSVEWRKDAWIPSEGGRSLPFYPGFEQVCREDENEVKTKSKSELGVNYTVLARLLPCPAKRPLHQPISGRISVLPQRLH